MNWRRINMNQDYYSNLEFSELVKRINEEMMRRSTYHWWDPFTQPTVGSDRSSPLSIPDIGTRVRVNDKTYTINNPSSGSIEPTRNIKYPAHGENPAGKVNKDILYKGDVPNTSAAELNVDELHNLLVGLSKIQDINLFYGRDEVPMTAFRNPQGIEDALVDAENSKLNSLLHESDISPTKNDPNGGITDRKNPDYPIEDHPVTYPMEDGKYIMPSGEFDGEEIKTHEGLGPHNFYDDYGALPGNANYHPFNNYISEQVRRDWHDQDNQRKDVHTFVVEGGKPSTRFGTNPRNPQMGYEYRSKYVYGGNQGSCVGQCVGLCYTTCDNICSESCETTCWNRCGNACTASCGNSCTSCSGQCMESCKTKCETVTGYACLKSGAKTVKITTVGGKDGIPAQNTISHTLHKCAGCSYSCQFYPNKKTECWDSGCMGKCFISCNTACSTSCYGGCIDNEAHDIDGYKYGKGRGCSAGCTLNCIGQCSGVCAGFCISTCFNTCKTSCSDNCTWTCMTMCGDGCSFGCTKGCTGCAETCTMNCREKANDKTCTGCSSIGGCKTECMFDCNRNCMGQGCRSICGIESAGACESNCRLSCMSSSCTSMCSDACSSMCTTCVNTCGFQCGACSSLCSTGCESACNINCTQDCSNNCSENCSHSCSEECGGCSNLCYSCVGMCIGICSTKCESSCSSCANQCGWWCDSSCNRACMSDCASYCINSCTGSCATYLTSNTNLTKGPDRPPTADGYIYPHPQNRWEERESFKLVQDIPQYIKPPEDYSHIITIATIPTKYYIIVEGDFRNISERILRVLSVDEDQMLLITNMANIDMNKVNAIYKYTTSEHFKIHLRHVYPGEFIYLWDTNILGRFDTAKMTNLNEKNIIVTCDTDVKYHIAQTSTSYGVWELDSEGNLVVNEELLGPIISDPVNINDKGSFYIVQLFYPGYLNKTIDYILPWGLNVIGSTIDSRNNMVIIIQRDETLYPSEF